MKKFKLTIAILTMNRSKQLKEAVESCLQCVLPEKTQFVIVDNASTDDTEKVVDELRRLMHYDVIYSKQSVNSGVGGGRNICYSLAEGEYIYFLDDDAVILEKSKEEFFSKSVKFLDDHSEVATLTTNVVDKIFGTRERTIAKTWRIGGLDCIYTFGGGTVFIRKSAFTDPLFMNILYGNEEITVSVKAIDQGFFNVYDDSIWIEHKPMINKWTGINAAEINVRGICNIYLLKYKQYPTAFRLLIWLAYRLRLKRSDISISDAKKFIKENCDEIRNGYIEKIRYSTVIKMYKQFGFKIF